MTKPDGGPAFPSVEQWNEWSELKAEYVPRTAARGGMSLRDYFAGQTLVGIVKRYTNKYGERGNEREAAERCYEFADAMIEARGK